MLNKRKFLARSINLITSLGVINSSYAQLTSTGAGKKVSGGGTFTPTDIAGLQLWLDASNSGSITIGTGVSQWNDLSGNARNVTQAVGGLQPTVATAALNGLNTVRFSAASSQTLTNTSAAMLRGVSGWTIAIVGKSTDISGSQYFVSTTMLGANLARAALCMGVATAGRINSRARRTTGDAGVNVTSSGAFGTGYGYFTATGDYTATTGIVRESGSQVAINSSWLTSGVTDSDGGELYIGSVAATNFLTGDLAEVLVYNSALSGTNLTNVETYLKNKWGL